MNRKFLNQEYQHQYVDGSGTPYKVIVYAENTTLSLIERYQGEWEFNGKRGNKISFSIKFNDQDFQIWSKFKDDSPYHKENLYVRYALEVMELFPNYEEYYKTALLLAKNNFKRLMESYENSVKRFEQKGSWEYPINTDPKMYEDLYKSHIRIYESIEISEDDLKMFKVMKPDLQEKLTM